MVSSIIFPTLLAILNLSLAIPLGPDVQTCSSESLSFRNLDKDKEFLLLASLTHDSLVSSTSAAQEGRSSYYPTTTSFSISRSSAAYPGHGLETVTVTVVLPASTTTEYITLPSSTTTKTTAFEPTSTLLFLPSPSFLPTQTPKIAPPQSTWSAPPHMEDLSSFNIMSFPSGQHNVKVVSTLPFASSRSPDDDSSLIRVLYPAHSINPAQSPVGGANFYASPLDLSSATNVSLQYRIFFPADFDWVKGGKLPGLYGGHTGCSGGSDAEDCFSTRLMWRAGGLGELYLYAPKSRQPDSVCSGPGSICNSDYGFSIGRGSFTWASDAWTTVTQTIVLNNDGKANGWFMLDVNGKLAIDRKDIYYRHCDQRSTPKPTKSITETSVTKTHTTQASTTKSAGGGLLGGLLDPLLGHNGGSKGILPGGLGLLTGRAHLELPSWPHRLQQLFSVDSVAETPTKSPFRDLIDADVQISLISASASIGDNGVSVGVGLGDDRGDDGGENDRPVGLVGIFFSTFFGGHDDKYKTPKDQYVWFKDFTLIINA